MSNENFTPLVSLALSREDQIRAYVHPTRMTILAALAAEQLTVSAIARQLGVHPANLTHHFKLLEKVGLIRLVEKRDTGKNLEKYYRAVAYTFTVSPDEQTRANPQALGLSILRDNLSAGLETLKLHPQGDLPVLALLNTVRLDMDTFPAFQQKLLDLLAEFKALDAPTGTAYNLSLALYPGLTPNPTDQEIFLGNPDPDPGEPS
jgi:DNA-binding transcriptional ArsR family regulator